MKTLFQPTIALLLFITVRCADLSITSGIAKSTLRAIVYGIVALLAIIAFILAVAA